MGAVTRAAGFRTRKRIEGRKKRKRIPNGACVFDECPIKLGDPDTELAKTTQLRCPSCAGGKGAFYHLPCFHACHRCYFAGGKSERDVR